MILHSPAIITPRLMAGVKIGDATISIDYDDYDTEGRVRYRYFIDFDDPAKCHSAADLASGVGGGSLQEGMGSLLTFLSAFAEAKGCEQRNPGYKSDNSSLFPEKLAEWACANSDEIASEAGEFSDEGRRIIIEEGNDP